jgi:hypothetical protein
MEHSESGINRRKFLDTGSMGLLAASMSGLLYKVPAVNSNVSIYCTE